MEVGSYESSSSENNSVSRQESTSSVVNDDEADLKNIFDEDFRDSLKTFSNDPDIEKKYKELKELLRLKKISDEFENTRKSRRFSYRDKTKKILEQHYPIYNAKYKVFEKLVAEWKPNREKLIESLSFDIHQLDRNFKWSTIVRILASSVEVSGTVGGLMFRSETGWANHAFNVASFCGLCGLFSTVAEVAQSKRILDEVSKAIENDHRLLLPIVKWFEESKELDSIAQELFPHGIDTDIVRQIQVFSAEQEDYLKIFKASLMSNMKDNELYRNSDFLGSLQLFATSKVAAVWWNRIIYRKHPILLDLGRMALQREFGQLQSIVFQCIPALPLEQQRLTSLPVAGRIMLNLLTLYDSFVDLKKGAESTHTDKLRKQLENMQELLEMIEDTVRMMKPHTLLPH
ncbi:hypothetical protein AVEN_189097-1 [Araneus ventricosus]|uniref:Uncharacterized protein n=1 Tax=Araneus ventricosus TaxID=182803 RepID=A0A4Y2HGC8_ARAVE|nr:hypothetical protein AVEN_189097-1 [Araneus ventricosus]